MEALERIPIFPLGVILFPASHIPLHIFEERYKQMCASAMEHHSIFGINYIEDTAMHSIGCAARISSITKKYEDGELDIVTEGVRRYEIVRLEQGASNELAYAEVRWIDDEPEERNSELAREAIELFNELCDVAYKGSIDPLDLEEWLEEDKLPSYAIAQKSGLTPEQRQMMLSIRSENERLTILRDHLKELLPKIQEAEAIHQLISNDGYLVNWNKKDED